MGLFYKYEENEKYRIYTLKNWAKLYFHGLVGMLLIFVFGGVGYAFLWEMLVAFNVMLFVSIITERRFINQHFMNHINGKEVIYKGGLLAYFSRKDYTILLEK